jgi:hypothetical protein
VRRCKVDEHLYSQQRLLGSHGASKHVKIIAYPTVEKAEQFIRRDLYCKSIVGLMGPIPNAYEEVECEASQDDTKLVFAFNATRSSLNSISIPLQNISFVSGNICFAIDKERQGLPLSIGRLCDVLVHIPHSSIAGAITLLNAPTCLSIVLDTLMRSFSHAESSFQGQKFSVARASSTHKYIDESAVFKADGGIFTNELMRSSSVDNSSDVSWDAGPRNDLKDEC